MINSEAEKLFKLDKVLKKEVHGSKLRLAFTTHNVAMRDIWLLKVPSLVVYINGREN